MRIDFYPQRPLKLDTASISHPRLASSHLIGVVCLSAHVTAHTCALYRAASSLERVSREEEQATASGISSSCFGKWSGRTSWTRWWEGGNRLSVSRKYFAKDNPCLIGDPGVRKTVIVEGLAVNIVRGIVPSKLEGKKIFALDMARLIAGTKFHGDFEERLTGIVDEVKQSDGNIILYIDEVHNLLGNGQTLKCC
ncbi:hypothetical protein SADUNF_Sadunf05G0144300 [Salix dunnii]|uniref:ATPase AAA-type core domain-containing protein n=1 Tax=Salix dunnii TaxID=1413687 RepID=A0A835K8M3_9ROSI|nr:hypothetical protein SADUNF_Sadunf05G0144300 [Salix dunnii]